MNEFCQNPDEDGCTDNPPGTAEKGYRCSDCGVRIPWPTEHNVYGLHNGASVCFPNLCTEHVDIRLRQAEVELCAREGDEILKNLDEWVTGQLRACGLSRKLLEARLDRVPAPYLEFIEPKILDGIRDGRLSVIGIGFVGDNETGKSMTLSAFLRVLLTANARRNVRKKGSRFNFKGIKWVPWSDTVNLWRLEGTKIDWDARNKFVRQCMDSNLLILDDLAREGKSGDRAYMDDPSYRLLDLILSTREANNLPTWWTSNLTTVEKLIQVYGAATVRRLIGPNPIIHVTGVKPFSRQASRPGS